MVCRWMLVGGCLVLLGLLFDLFSLLVVVEVMFAHNIGGDGFDGSLVVLVVVPHGDFHGGADFGSFVVGLVVIFGGGVCGGFWW